MEMTTLASTGSYLEQTLLLRRQFNVFRILQTPSVISNIHLFDLVEVECQGTVNYTTLIRTAQHAEPAFSYTGSRIKHCTLEDIVTKAIYKIFEKNLKFHVKYCSTGKVHYLVLSNFLPVLTAFLFWEEDWTLD